MQKRERRISKQAFTLIELLTVIAIIGILAALLFPAIKSSMTKAETSKAQSAITSALSTAFRAYYTEYGKWPIADPDPNHTYIVDANFVALLQGANPTKPPNPLGPNEPSFFGPPYTPFFKATLQGNPRGIHFLDFKAADLDASGAFVDPWKRPYYCRFDVSYQNQIDYPFYLPGKPVAGGFLIWSVGPNGQYDRDDTIVTASPLVVKPSAANKDNIISW